MTKRFIVFLLCALAAVVAAAQGEPVAEIIVKGNENVSTEAIRAVMETRQGDPYQQSRLGTDRQNIEQLGFFADVRVFGQFMEDRRWRVVVEVVEWGIINEIRISGNTVVTADEVKNKMSLKVGEPFNSNSLVPDARAIQEVYRTKGYFAIITKFEPAQEDKHILLVEIAEVRVNEVTITGLTRTKPDVVRKLIDTKKGDLFNQQVWTEDLRRVFNTRWFDEIDPDSSQPEAGLVDLSLDLKEGRTGNFNIGVQLDPRGRLAGLITYNDTNLFGSGRSAGINLIQSTQGLGTSLQLDYGDPFLDGRRTSLNASVYSRESLVFGRDLLGGGQEEIADTNFSQRKTGANVTLSRVYDRRTRFFYGVRGEGIDSRDFEVDPGEEFIVQDGFIATLSLGALRNRRDNNLDPAKGDYTRISIEPSFAQITEVAGQTSGFDIIGENFFTKVSLDYRAYFSPQAERTAEELDAPRRVFAVRALGGIIAGDVPFFEQFFVGGSGGIRGYTEDRFWGKNQLMFQAEYRHPIQKTFSVIAFVDYGGAWGGYPGINEFSQSNEFKLHLGYGFGIMFRTALGPLRLDIGFDEKGKSRTHFLLGGSF